MIADKYAQRNQKQNKSTLIMYLVTKALIIATILWQHGKSNNLRFVVQWNLYKVNTLQSGHLITTDSNSMYVRMYESNSCKKISIKGTYI